MNFTLTDEKGVQFNTIFMVFATNDKPIVRGVDGYIGIATCPNQMKQYSFQQAIADYLGSSVLTNIEWDPVPTMMHTYDNDIGGYLKLNEPLPDDVDDWLVSDISFSDLLDDTDLTIDAEKPGYNQFMFFPLPLGNTIRYPKFMNGIRIYNNQEFQNDLNGKA